MGDKKENFDTQRIHAGYHSEEHNYAVSVPIYQTAAFDLGDLDRARRLWTGNEKGGIYSRISNPTTVVLQERLAALDNGVAALGVGSGMAAITYILLALAEGGGNIVSGSSLYGAAQEALAHFFPRFGITTKFVKNRDDVSEYESLIDEKTRVIYLESISNPNAEIYDFEAIAEIAHKHGIPVVVDNTVATPYLFDSFKHGADFTVYSTTKGISGHGNAISGVIVEKGDFQYSKEKFPQFYEKSYKMRDLDGHLRSPIELAPKNPVIASISAFHLEFMGATLSPFNAYLVLQGLSTISERLTKQMATTHKLVEYLENHPHVEWIRHPHAKQSRYAKLAEKYFPKGAGSVFSFGFNGTKEQMNTFIKSLQIFSYHVNIGDVRSLIVNSPQTTHAELNPELHELANIPDNLLRVSVGLEDANDLINDLDNAFTKAFNETIKE